MNINGIDGWMNGWGMITAEGDGCPGAAEDVAPEFRVGNDGRLLYRNVEEPQHVGAIFQIEQQRRMAANGRTFRLYNPPPNIINFKK